MDSDPEFAVDPQRDLTLEALEGLTQRWVLDERVGKIRRFSQGLDCRTVMDDSAPREPEFREVGEKVAESLSAGCVGDRKEDQVMLLAEGDDVVDTAMIKAPRGGPQSLGASRNDAIRQ
eukprot:2069449-Rhodomonas_salina.1